MSKKLQFSGIRINDSGRVSGYVVCVEDRYFIASREELESHQYFPINTDAFLDNEVYLDSIRPLESVNYRKAKTTQESLELAARYILSAIGENLDRTGLTDTPARFAKMMQEVTRGMEKSPEQWAKDFEKTFQDAEDDFTSADPTGFRDLVIVRDVPIYSLCEHHLVPFFGKITVGYIPKDKVIGISKIARLAQAVAARPQVQERLTSQIGDSLMTLLGCAGVMVVCNCRHLCMESRGVKSYGTETITSAVRGIFKEDSKAREEFLQLIQL